MQLPISARIPEPDETCAANYGLRELAGVFATAMLSPGEADVVPVELTYEDGQKDIVVLISGGGNTALACVLFGPADSTSEQFLTWGRGIKAAIQDAIDVYDVEPEVPSATDQSFDGAADRANVVNRAR